MQSPASFLAVHGISESELDMEFDAEAMLQQLASQKETAARAPFMAPALIREQMMRMELRQAMLRDVEIAEDNRFKVAHDSQDMTGAMPVFRKAASVTRSKIDPVNVVRQSPFDTPKERFRGLPARRSQLRECIDYASLSELLAEIQMKQSTKDELVSQNELSLLDDMASRFSTELPRVARSGAQSLMETLDGCVAVFKLLFFGASLGFIDSSNW